MNPVALRDPSGVVRGWMCGVCLHAQASSEYLGQNADEKLVERWRESAETCCVCRECGGPAPRAEKRYFGGDCDACTERQVAEGQARREAQLGGPTARCPRCHGSPDYYGDVIDNEGERCCTRCEDRGYVLASTVTPPPTTATEGGQ